MIRMRSDDECPPRPDGPGCTGSRLRLRRPVFATRAPPFLSTLVLALAWLVSLSPVAAVFLPFEDCLPDSYIYTKQAADQVQLQWVPLYLDAVFDNEDDFNLKVTVWGNVTGRVGDEVLPDWDNTTAWLDPNYTLGKIQDEPDPSTGKATTLHSKVDVVTYEPWSSNLNFCDSVVNGTCPLAPVFYFNQTDLPYILPSFNLSANFGSSYALTSFAPTFIIWYGDADATSIGCVSAVVTPALGGLAWFLRMLPVFALVLVGVATVFAAVFSPWGTSDVFHWTSNYGRDPDLLRLVTPGFGDCLQYIQFIALTGGLSLDYPGFYQPVASKGAWSTLMFNESFVANADPWEGLVDGVYVTEGSYGMQRLAQLVGMAEVEDIWAGMMIWLLVIIGAALLVIQVGFFCRWLRRHIKHTSEEDLRAKNFPFSAGNVVRLVFGYFLLPIVALSTFQLVVAGQSAVVLVVMAVITLLLFIGFAIWLMYLVATTKPRAHLFDDLPTVLLYGSLYNTYSDEAAAFALIPVILTFMRGIALGAVQPSGIAQIVILAVCEVVQMLTLFAFRPFDSSTSMNAYHAGFSVLRFISVLLMVAFAPTMGVTEGPKGWIGYAILLIHGAVLIFGFALNALQTIIEVIARMCGAGGDDIRGQTRGGLSKIFGARQLQKRTSRRGGPSRQSQLSTSAMLGSDHVSKRGYGRMRSESGSMGILMHNAHRSSSVLGARSMDGLTGPGTVPGTPGESGASFPFLPSPGQATRPQPVMVTATADPYYRQPRTRRPTNEEAGSPGYRGSTGSVDLSDRRFSQAAQSLLEPADMDGVFSGRATPAPGAAYTPAFAPRADYSTREVDFYYGVRGPALNSEAPSRRLGTGPADPTSPLATATGWLKSLFGGKTKEKHKGFEVVRSARMPPAMKARGGEYAEDAPPEGIPVAMGVLRNGPIDSDDEDTPPVKRERPVTSDHAHEDLLDEGGSPRTSGSGEDGAGVSREAPLLPDLDSGEGFQVPSRRSSSRTVDAKPLSAQTGRDVLIGPVPHVPRKSSKRRSVGAELIRGPSFKLVPPPSEAAETTQAGGDRADESAAGTSNPAAAAARLPFERSKSQKRLSGSSWGASDDYSQQPSAPISAADSGDERPTSYGIVHHHNISRTDPSSDQRVDLLASEAELVNNSRKVSPNSSTSGHSR